MRSTLNLALILILCACPTFFRAHAQGPAPAYNLGGSHGRMVMPAPLGASVRAWEAVQRASAEDDDFVVYLAEWLDANRLGPYGAYHLEQMAKRLPGVPFPVLIQTCGNPALDQLRRATVVHLLAGCGITDVEARVIIGRPRAEGLYGDEGLRVFLPRLAGGSGGGGGNILGSRGGVGGIGGMGFGGMSGIGGFGLGGFGGGR